MAMNYSLSAIAEHLKVDQKRLFRLLRQAGVVPRPRSRTAYHPLTEAEAEAVLAAAHLWRGERQLKRVGC